MNVTNLVAALVAAVAAVVAAIAAILIYGRQKKDQEQFARRQRMLEACRELSNHLVSWHDQLRAVVRNRDTKGILNYRAQIGDYMDMLDNTRGEIEQFKEGDHYQGPLDGLLLVFDPEGSSSNNTGQFAGLVKAVKIFQAKALKFKDTEVEELIEILQALERSDTWSERKNPESYNEQIDKNFEAVEDAYKNAMREIHNVMRAFEPR